MFSTYDDSGELENPRKHISNFDNTPSTCMPLKPKLEYEKVIEKHVKEDVVNLVKS